MRVLVLGDKCPEGVGPWWRMNIRLDRREFIEMSAPCHPRVHTLTRMFKVKASLNQLLEWFLEA